jgi:thiol-disulfide isomerase/thioredoxin
VTAIERVGPAAFDGPRLRRPGVWAVDFSADWCPFCREFLPEFAQLGHRDGAALLVADLTSYSSPLWERFSIDVLPTVLVFRDGEEIARVDGRLGEGLGPHDLAIVRAALGSETGRQATPSRRDGG